MLRAYLPLIATLLMASPVSAQTWAEQLFDGRSRDFGTVPRGPTLSHAFYITNKTGQPIHIAGIRVSCGCVSAAAQKRDLAPGETTAIVAEMDTRRFSGQKSVTVYVQFDRPRWEEVGLLVQANGRDDVSFTPEALAFGHSRKGVSPTASVNLALSGFSDLRVIDAKCDSNFVNTTLQELKRGTYDVTYKLSAQVRGDCPVGRWYTDVWVTTNNPVTPRIRVPLSIEIEPSLTVSPPVANLGQVATGQEVEKKIIVRGAQPFRISAIQGEDGQLSVKDNTEGSKPVHVLTVKLKAGAVGDVQRTVRIVTDLADEGSVEFQATAQVVQSTEAASDARK
jgi:hypothetical protein